MPAYSVLDFENGGMFMKSADIIGKCRVIEGDSTKLITTLPDESIDIVVTSPPYWGQRTSMGLGIEQDPREYLNQMVTLFQSVLPKMKSTGVFWLNVGDAYNTPVNWREEDHKFSSLGSDQEGLSPDNSAYKKNREKRRAFLDKKVGWLKYGNLLALPYRMVIGMVEKGFIFRGEVIWKKLNPMPEGRCRRPHRAHESIYLLAKSENHTFTVSPPIKSVWEFANEGRKEEYAHYSRFPEELPRRCILASGRPFQESTVVLDPFAGSGTTGVVAKELGLSFVGFEIDSNHVKSANSRIGKIRKVGSQKQSNFKFLSRNEGTTASL